MATQASSPVLSASPRGSPPLDTPSHRSGTASANTPNDHRRASSLPSISRSPNDDAIDSGDIVIQEPASKNEANVPDDGEESIYLEAYGLELAVSKDQLTTASGYWAGRLRAEHKGYFSDVSARNTYAVAQYLESGSQNSSAAVDSQAFQVVVDFVKNPPNDTWSIDRGLGHQVLFKVLVVADIWLMHDLFLMTRRSIKYFVKGCIGSRFSSEIDFPKSFLSDLACLQPIYPKYDELVLDIGGILCSNSYNTTGSDKKPAITRLLDDLVDGPDRLCSIHEAARLVSRLFGGVLREAHKNIKEAEETLEYREREYQRCLDMANGDFDYHD